MLQVGTWIGTSPPTWPTEARCASSSKALLQITTLNPSSLRGPLQLQQGFLPSLIPSFVPTQRRCKEVPGKEVLYGDAGDLSLAAGGQRVLLLLTKHSSQQLFAGISLVTHASSRGRHCLFVCYINHAMDFLSKSMQRRIGTCEEVFYVGYFLWIPTFGRRRGMAYQETIMVKSSNSLIFQRSQRLLPDL